MTSDLRARIKAVANKPKPQPQAAECKAYTYSHALTEMPGVLDVTADQVRRLGLEHPGFDVRRALFLDTETTGLRGAGTVAFLIGVGYVQDDAFVVRQFLMRDYPEEAHQLEQLGALLPQFESIVTFNGKSFDVPLLRDRFLMARLRHLWRDLPHLDLLHTARRTWKLRLGVCNLGYLEEMVLDITREGDLPGAEVPERFFRYLKEGDISLLDDVLRHNEQDIVTLGVLLAKLSQVYGAPEEQTSMLDVFSVGRALEKCGDGEAARRCFKVASVSRLSKKARIELAKSYRREKDYRQAADAYRSLIARGEADAADYTSLAILLERYLRDPQEALQITEKALLRFSGAGFLQGADPETLASLERRRKRLKTHIDKLR